jgi:hypothetical protein
MATWPDSRTFAEGQVNEFPARGCELESTAFGWEVVVAEDTA